MAFDMPMLEAFAPPNVQDGIFPRLQGAGRFRVQLIPNLRRVGGEIRSHVQRWKGKWRRGGGGTGGVGTYDGK